MIIIQDFREKHGHHEEIATYCKENNILLYRMKLEVGDYMLGTFENGKVMIKEGQKFSFVCQNIVGDNTKVQVNYHDLYKYVKVGNTYYYSNIVKNIAYG